MSGAGLGYTAAQLAAIGARGGSLLVSAGAGSGKTRVLVERLLQYISGEDACDITEFLIITYTRAAAEELRSRILDAISERLGLEPDNRHLRRQAALCMDAPIGTIHSFCADLLRENAHLAGLSPDFRVADENEASLLKESVLEDLLDARYEALDSAPDFALLVDSMSAGRDDGKLRQIILEAHAKLQSHANPEAWIRGQISVLEAQAPQDAGETVWGAFLMEDARKKAAYWLSVLRGLADEAAESTDLEKAYGGSIATSSDGLERFMLALARGWDAAAACADIPFPKAKAVSGYDIFKDKRTKCRAAVRKVTGLFDICSRDLLEDMTAARPAVTALLRLVLEFDGAYSLAKRKRSLADFSDLEHLTARLLVDFGTSERTDTAKAVARRFREILIDEYQDVSRVQELIFGSVSKNNTNVFMVGDVKQSIYRFRLADPTIFLGKYKTYADFEPETLAQTIGRRVLLSANFRSRAGILDAVNFIFTNVMSEEFGEMAYTQLECLVPGRMDASDPSAGASVELDVLDLSGLESPEDEEDPEKTAVEADFVARRIEELLIGGMLIPDGHGGIRPLERGDIAILLRSVRDKAAVYEKALADRNIPAAHPAGEGFFETMEVSVAVSLLGIIDNPRQDIPLIAVLRSPLFGFTSDELAEVRLADKNADFYSALVIAGKTDSKAGAFLDTLGALRLAAPEMPADRFLWHVYEKTSMLAVMGALRNGAARRQNLMRLMELAVRSQANGYRGLFGFVTLLRRLMETGKEPLDGGETPSGDVVRIMSIHKSKGLEFPVVILADTAKRFNKRDATAPLLIHSELGIGPKRTDLERRIEYPTLARLAVAKKLTQEMLSEELRVLYVAMTRAREKLILVATFADAGRELLKLEKDASSPIPPQVLENTPSMAGFILLPALLRPEAAVLRQHQDQIVVTAGEPWEIRKIVICEPPAKAGRQQPQEAAEPAKARLEDIEKIRENLTYVYPHTQAAEIPSKLTATGLKGRFIDAEAAEEADAPAYAKAQRAPALRPDFITERTALTASERGTALHLAMQYIDFSKCGTVDGVRQELDRLREENFLGEKQALAVDPLKIAAFFSSALGRRVLKSKKLYREFKFSLLVPAAAYYPEHGLTDDEILLQGVVDCAFEEDGALHIIDFKTDLVTPETLEEKRRLYAPQLIAYGQAMARITGQTVASRIIYFFALGEAAEITE